MASKTHPIQVYVIANGCTDCTETLVRDFAATRPWIELVSIALGDKSNAWNLFVHDLASQEQVCFFVDGDVRVTAGSFDALSSALHVTPGANGAAAIPISGRNRRKLQRLVCEEYLILGNLYALQGQFVCRIRNEGIRLPIGYIGDDGMVTSLAKWDLNPMGPFIHERIVPCPSASFAYRSLSPKMIRDWQLYWRRCVRYSLRHFQDKLMSSLLMRKGIKEMPNTAKCLYSIQREELEFCRPRLGPNVLFDIIAIRKMRRSVRLS